MATRWTVTIDCANPAKLAKFWALALGYVEPDPPAGFDTWDAWMDFYEIPDEERDDGAFLADPDDVGPTLSFLRVPEGKVAKNRMHLDVQVGGGRDETPWETRWPRVLEAVERLTKAGATVLREHRDGDHPDHMEMADPEGNEFCLV